MRVMRESCFFFVVVRLPRTMCSLANNSQRGTNNCHEGPHTLLPLTKHGEVLTGLFLIHWTWIRSSYTIRQDCHSEELKYYDDGIMKGCWVQRGVVSILQ